MAHAPKDQRQQLGFFQPEIPTTIPKHEQCFGIPIYKVTLVRERKMPWGDTRMRNSQMVSALLHKYLEGVDREHLCVVLLSQKNEIVGVSTISVGSLTASVAHPREIYKIAILANCASIILAHNHPSGAPRSA